MPQRRIITPLALAVACLPITVSPGARAETLPQTGARLTCLVDDPVARRLCDAVRAALDQGSDIDPAAPLHLVLRAHSAQPDTLTASLSRADATAPAGDAPPPATASEPPSPPLSLSVMDRPTIPDDRIADFAKALIANALSSSD